MTKHENKIYQEQYYCVGDKVLVAVEGGVTKNKTKYKGPSATVQVYIIQYQIGTVQQVGANKYKENYSLLPWCTLRYGNF